MLIFKVGLMFKNDKDCNRNKDLKLIIIMYTPNKSIRLPQVVIMIKDCKYVIKLLHVRMEQMHL